MRPRTFYRSAVWLPLVVSGVVLATDRWFGEPEWAPLSLVYSTLWPAAVFGSIPYGLLAAWAWWELRARKARDPRHLALLMPLLMIPTFAGYAVIYAGMSGGGVRDAIGLVLIGIFYILLIGYAYVGLVLRLAQLGLRVGVLHPEPGDTAA